MCKVVHRDRQISWRRGITPPPRAASRPPRTLVLTGEAAMAATADHDHGSICQTLVIELAGSLRGWAARPQLFSWTTWPSSSVTPPPPKALVRVCPAAQIPSDDVGQPYSGLSEGISGRFGVDLGHGSGSERCSSRAFIMSFTSNSLFDPAVSARHGAGWVGAVQDHRFPQASAAPGRPAGQQNVERIGIGRRL
jgi:hypothetical protein